MLRSAVLFDLINQNLVGRFYWPAGVTVNQSDSGWLWKAHLLCHFDVKLKSASHFDVLLQISRKIGREGDELLQVLCMATENTPHAEHLVARYQRQS